MAHDASQEGVAIDSHEPTRIGGVECKARIDRGCCDGECEVLDTGSMVKGETSVQSRLVLADGREGWLSRRHHRQCRQRSLARRGSFSWQIAAALKVVGRISEDLCRSLEVELRKQGV